MFRNWRKWVKENLPPWFDLQAYERVTTWSPSRWEHEIFLRRSVKYSVTFACEYNQDESENKIIGNVNFEGTWDGFSFLLPQEKARLFSDPNPADLFTKNDLLLESNYLVTSLRIKDAISLYREFSELPAFKNSMKIKDELREFIKNNLDKVIAAGSDTSECLFSEYLKDKKELHEETLVTVFGDDYFDLPYKNLTSHYGLPDYAETIIVNLNASDDAIKTAFSVWLNQQRLTKKPPLPILSRGQQRNETPLHTKRRQGEKHNLEAEDFEKWVNWRLLPYIDINLWRKAFDKTEPIKFSDWEHILSFDEKPPRTLPELDRLANWLLSDDAQDLLQSAIILDKNTDK